MAAPHAVGTIALLMSYLDSTAPAYQNLSPEDAQQLLTLNANNKGYVGHSDSTGWGALNAGKTLQAVNKSCKELVHLGKGNNANLNVLRLAINTPIKLTERYTNPSGQTYDTITYYCNVFQATNTMSQHLDSNFVITASWARPSSTTLLLVYDSINHTLQPFEHLYIDSISATTAIVTGYYYSVYSDSFQSNYLGKWGIYDTANTDSLRFDYTLLLNNPTINCHPVDTSTTHIKEIANNMQVSFHPNPVDDAGVLQIFTDENTKATIDIMDQQGRTIETIYSGDISNGGTTFNIDTKALSSGLYMIVISSGEGTKTIKFLKYETD
jgi:hypothetical protein